MTPGPATEGIRAPKLLLMTGWVLGCFVACDLVGVALVFFFDMVGALRGGLQTNTTLAYAIWFVVGVFCAVFLYPVSIYPSTDFDDCDSPEGRRMGLVLLVITSVVAVVLGELSSLVWSDSGAGELSAPDHRGVTITYLVTAVLGVAAARFLLFRERVRAEPGAAEPPPKRERFEPKVERGRVAAKPEPDRQHAGAFQPAGVLATVGLLIGVPVLLFLEAHFLLLELFDCFDRWTDLILKTSLGGGLAWGFASARWRTPREWLLVAHLPLLTGAVFGFFALLLGGLLVAFDASERVAEIVSYVGFGIGFLLGCVAVVGKFAGFVHRAAPGRMVRR